MNSLIPVDRHTELAESVDRIVRCYHPKPEQACAWYAILGAQLLNRTVGCTQYGCFAGTFEIFVSPDPDDPKYSLNLCFNAHEPQIPGLEFHCWIARPDPIEQTYPEVIDFSARHFKTRALELNLPWNRDPLPDFIWTDLAGVEALKIKRLQAIPSLTQIIMHNVTQDLPFKAAAHALHRQY